MRIVRVVLLLGLLPIALSLHGCSEAACGADGTGCALLQDGGVAPHPGGEGGENCGANEFYYDDRSCGLEPPDAGPSTCRQMGDLLCYKICVTDADCTDPVFKHCATLGLNAGGDYNCNSTVSICMDTARKDCTR